MQKPIGFDKKRTDTFMEEEGVDAIIAMAPQNVFYTTGLPSLYNDVIPLWGIVNRSFPQFSIIPRDGDQVLVALSGASRDARIHSWVKDFRGYEARDEAFEIVKTTLEEKAIAKGTIAVEEMIPGFAYDSLRKSLPDATFKMVADEILTKVKMIKSDEEIRRLKKAGEIGQKAIKAAIDNMREGVEITELVQIIKSTMIREGATGWYHTNCWCEKKPEEDKAWFSKLSKGDLVNLDIGAVYHGYTSDLRRMALIGIEPPESVKKIYDVICEAADVVMESIKPGIKLGEIFRIAHDILHKAGYPGRFGWSIGHSIGVEVEEEPKILESSIETFKPNMAFAVEMWYQVEPYPVFGVGLEETGIITEKGFEKYTTLDREIYIV
ncbi:MAG: M24 family metallopeptidase [Candidatus Bathyarchaeia archaeon]